MEREVEGGTDETSMENDKTKYESFSALNIGDSDDSPENLDANKKLRRATNRLGDDDDDEAEFKLPELDWENLEAKLKIAQQEVNQQVRFLNFNIYIYIFLFL